MSPRLDFGGFGRVAGRTLLTLLVAVAGCVEQPGAAEPGGGVSEEPGSVGPGSGLRFSDDPWDRAEALGLIAPDGSYLGPVDSNGQPLLVDAITGYGDFSGEDWFLIDWVLVNTREVECMNDHGFPVTLHADGLGTNWANVPEEQNQLAQAVSYACRDGLNLPARVGFSHGQWEELFAYQLGLAECIRGAGYTVLDPPTLDAFIESEGAVWDAYIDVQARGPVAWDALVRACPPAPPGGFGAWDPGDPVGRPRGTSSSTPASDVDALAGVIGVTRITEGLDELVVEWGLVAPDGALAGPFDPAGGILLLEPISGYGNFSDYTAQQVFDVDLAAIQELVFGCVADTDVRFAELIAETGWFNWNALEGQLSQVGMAVFIACDRGLELPSLDQSGWTEAMWAESYAHHTAWIDCVEREAGIDWGPRLSLEEYQAQAPAYEFSPENQYATLDNATLQYLDDACPSNPVGGFEAWDPGDAVGG